MPAQITGYLHQFSVHEAAVSEQNDFATLWQYLGHINQQLLIRIQSNRRTPMRQHRPAQWYLAPAIHQRHPDDDIPIPQQARVHRQIRLLAPVSQRGLDQRPVQPPHLHPLVVHPARELPHFAGRIRSTPPMHTPLAQTDFLAQQQSCQRPTECRRYPQIVKSRAWLQHKPQQTIEIG